MNGCVCVFNVLISSSGCVGGIVALGNMLGNEVCQLYSLFKQGKLDECKTLQHRLIAPNAAVNIMLCYPLSMIPLD